MPAASKISAMLFCLDIGPGMEQPAENDKSFLDNAIEVIKLMVQRKIFSESKDLIGLVLFGTEDTENDLAEDDSYQHITVPCNLLQPSFDFLEFVSNKITTGTHEADFVDAITVSLDILHNASDPKIDRRHIVLLSNFSHPFNDDSLEGIIQGFNNDGKEVELHVIAPEFESKLNEDASNIAEDDDRPGPSNAKRPKLENLRRKPKSQQQKSAENIIEQIIDQVEGGVYTYSEAISESTVFEKRKVKSMPWKCDLQIGELLLPCSAYVKVKKSVAKSWKKCHAKTHKAEDIEIQKYFTLDDNDQTEVDKENVIKGYKYGKDVIPFSKEDVQAMKYQTEGKCLSVLGFTDSSNIRREYFCGDQSHIIVPSNDDENAALSALVIAMQNQSTCAVARYVYRKGLNPKLVALIPKVKEDYQYLVMVTLPYVEDTRELDFPMLVKEKEATDEQIEIVEQFIEGMTCDKENELYRPKEMPNPSGQRVFQCLQARALGVKELPQCSSHIQSILAPNPDLVQRNKQPVEKMKKIFKLTATDEQKKTKGKEAWIDMNVKKEDTDNINNSNGILSAASSAVGSVGSVNPRADFEEILQSTSDSEAIEKAFKELQQRILEFINDSFWSGINPKVVICISAMKKHAISCNQVPIFNNFLKSIKEKLVGQGNKNSYWKEILKENVTLIDNSEHKDGVEVTEKTAFSINESGDTNITEELDGSTKQDDIDADDLLDML